MVFCYFMHIFFQINPISPEKVQLAKQNFPHETNELLETSEFIDVLPEFPVTFKRPVTVKLPLPARFEESEEKKASIANTVNFNGSP